MLAGGPVQAILQRQHLKAPCAHTAEVVAGGNNVNMIIPVSGVLQEAHIRQGVATPLYLDSRTTVLVASDDAAAKRSVWLKRRIVVLQDAVDLGEIVPIHVPESNMVADIFTKYLKLVVWQRHVAYLLNDSTRACADVKW